VGLLVGLTSVVGFLIGLGFSSYGYSMIRLALWFGLWLRFRS
jgi:hypothetical protein